MIAKVSLPLAPNPFNQQSSQSGLKKKKSQSHAFDFFCVFENFDNKS